MINSHKTAITRKKLSQPIQYIKKNNLFNGNCLDFGCGRGFDANSLNLDKFDPHYFPEYPTKKYDTITSIYVLNVVDENEQQKIIDQIKSLLNENGLAYIAVRRDSFIEGFNKKGTYQRKVFLKENENCQLIKSDSNFALYKIKN